MTDQEMRIAIARASRWKNIRMATKGAGAPERRPSPYGFPPGREYEAPVTNYPMCLNAMHEAVRAQDNKFVFRYAQHLEWIVERDRSSHGEDDSLVHCLISEATAKQRATAFCMTLFPERFKE